MTDYKQFIGIDIGGTNTKIALVGEDGQISHLDKLWMENIQSSLEDYLQNLYDRVNQIFQECNQTILGIGISVPGLQRPDGFGTLYSVNVPFLNGFDLAHYFINRFKIPVHVINDLVAHGLAEYKFGSGKGIPRLLCVSLGTGIGHTFFFNGIPQLIINGISGDSGRMILDVQSNVSDMSGVAGSAEALCGVKSIEILAKSRCTRSYSSAMEIITAARTGEDPGARDVLIIISRRLAHYLMNLSSIYFPEVITISGGQTEAGDFFFEECRKEFSRLSVGFFEKFFKLTRKEQGITIKKAEAGSLAGLLGSIVPIVNN
jgi:glucokinase